MKETLVVIPYYAAGAQGRELWLAVAGWVKHFKDPFRIIIVGDFDDDVAFSLAMDERVCFMPSPRVEDVPGQYRPHIDHVRKFQDALKAFPGTQGFIYTCDDIYAVKDFTLTEVLVPKISCKEIPPIDYRREKDWFKDLGKTREYCAKMGWPTMNWVCHLPVYYKVYDWAHMVARMNMAGNSFIMENLYFNLDYYTNKFMYGDSDAEPEFVPETGGPWKYGVQTSSPDFSTVEETGAVWITNSNSGWSPRLEEILRSHYGLS